MQYNTDIGKETDKHNEALRYELLIIRNAIV